MSLLKTINSPKTFGDFFNALNTSFDVPFFFNGRFGTYYRFEGLIYNFSTEDSLRNFALI